MVASEVRALTQRSASAAREINTLILDSNDQVSLGVRLVSETGEALEGITEEVNRVSSIVGTIASSSGEQATALQDVNTAVNQLDQVTQQNAAMVEESTAASQDLATSAGMLGSSVERFQIGSSSARTTTSWGANARKVA